MTQHSEPAEPMTHPGWCDPFACVTTDVDVQHFSHPTVLTTRDAEVDLRLTAADEYAHPGEPGEVELMFHVRSLSLQGHAAQVALGEREILQLGLALIETYHRMRMLTSPPVVRPEVAS